MQGDPDFSVMQAIRRTGTISGGAPWGIGGAAQDQGYGAYGGSNLCTIDQWGRTTINVTGYTLPLDEWVIIHWIKTSGNMTVNNIVFYINDVKYETTQLTERHHKTMPKEITHLTLAEKVFQELSSTSLFHHPIKKFFNVFLYGSVAPDTPFYYLMGPHSSAIQNFGKLLHTSDSSCLLPILGFLNRFSRNDEDALSFAAGLCCHILTDTHFHPLVYYFAGMDGIHKGATTRHRLFETALDFYFWPHSEKDIKISLYQILSHLNISKGRISLFFETLFRDEGNNREKAYPHAVRSHCMFQGLFKNFKLYRIIRFLHTHNFGIRSKDEALFYPYEKPTTINFFSKRLHYRDPCTGTVHADKIDDLTRQAVDNVLLLLDILERYLIQGKDVSQAMHDSNLPRIRPCVPPQKDTFRFWNGRKQLRQIIYSENRW